MWSGIQPSETNRADLEIRLPESALLQEDALLRLHALKRSDPARQMSVRRRKTRIPLLALTLFITSSSKVPKNEMFDFRQLVLDSIKTKFSRGLIVQHVSSSTYVHVVVTFPVVYNGSLVLQIHILLTNFQKTFMSSFYN